MEEAKTEGSQNYFNDTLDFNAWQLTPAFKNQYSDIIGKDAPLSNIASKNEMEYIDLNLRTATYLNGVSQKVFKGFNFVYESLDSDERFSIYLEVDSIDEGVSLLGDVRLLEAKKVFEQEPIMKKSVHNKLSRAYTRMALSRGINGQAAKDLKTARVEEHKTLQELTDRGAWNPFRKTSNNWSEYEKQKR